MREQNQPPFAKASEGQANQPVGKQNIPVEKTAIPKQQIQYINQPNNLFKKYLPFIIALIFVTLLVIFEGFESGRVTAKYLSSEWVKNWEMCQRPGTFCDDFSLTPLFHFLSRLFLFILCIGLLLQTISNIIKKKLRKELLLKLIVFIIVLISIRSIAFEMGKQYQLALQNNSAIPIDTAE